MSLNSVNTNMSAMVALESLQATNSQLQTVQKRVSTGFRVADAVDDGAAYAVRLFANGEDVTAQNGQVRGEF